MLKRLLAAAAFAACFTGAASAQDTQPAAPPPAVETMTCDQMNGEMMTAGMTMNSQLDREGLNAENQAIQDDIARRRQQGMAQGVGMGLACSIPGVGAACGAMMAAQVAQAQRDAEASRVHTDRQTAIIQDSMAGLDQQRLMAMSQRYEQMQCQTPH
jgi:hypothetical protein